MEPVLNWFKVNPYVSLWVLGIAWTNITLYFKGKFFSKDSDSLSLSPNYHPFPHRVICLKLGIRRNYAEAILVSCLPAILDHSPASPGHGRLVSSYTSVSCHFKPASTDTIPIAATDTISALLPLWPGVSILLNFSILVITVSSVALKIIC